MRILLTCTALLLSASLAHAAQVVVLDVTAGSDVNPRLNAGLTAVLVGELSRVQGISVVSQGDVRALLEHEANKQALGCTDNACMADIAGNLGAELLLATQVSRVADAWTAQLTLLRASDGKVVRRVSASQKGGEGAAQQAVIQAVVDLMRDGLPTDVQGPASFSRRGFEAALLGFSRTALEPKGDVKAARRRIILDLVNTELDYDAQPKLDMLDLSIRRNVAGLEKELLLARDAADLQRYLGARVQWISLGQDKERVKEIRARARERGLVPSASPLRFEDWEAPDLPDAALVQKYLKAQADVRKQAEAAVKAYAARDAKTWVALWSPDYADQANRLLEHGPKDDATYGYTYDLLPLHAHPPWLLRDSSRTLEERNELVVFVRRFAKGAINDERRLVFKKDGTAWHLKSAW